MNKENALSRVRMALERVPLEYSWNGDHVPTGREAIIRTDAKDESGVPGILGYVSPDYRIITHEAALDSAYTALEKAGVPFNLLSLGLDKGGATMQAQFEVGNKYKITDAPGDTLSPVLTLGNGLDGSKSLIWTLESIRTVCLNLAKSAIRDAQNRYLHVGDASPDHLLVAAQQSLVDFEDKVVPFYRQLAGVEVSKDTAVRAVVAAAQAKAIPLNVANFAKHCVESDSAEKEGIKRTLWALYNAFTWASTKRSEDLSPTRYAEIRGGISKLFSDGGQTLLETAAQITDEDVAETFGEAA